MRRGIGLRGYAQQDPLNEFKREAFQLYDELRGLIRHGVASSIFRVTVTRQPHADGGRSGRGRLARPGSGSADRRERCQRPSRRLPAMAVASRPMRASRRLPPPEVRPSCAAARPRHPRRDRCAPRSATSRSPATVSVRRPAAAGRSPGSRPVVNGSGATIRAGAVPARSTRSVTGAEPGAATLARTIHVEAPIVPARPGRGRAPRPASPSPSSPATRRSGSGPRESATTVGRPMPSSCWAPPNTTAGRPRCSGPGSTTRSSCTTPASRRASS